MHDQIETDDIEIAVGDETRLDAFLAKPSEPGRFPAVIVCMELFGLNAHTKDIAKRVAALGYLAIAPNFYHRTLPHASLPFGEEGRTKGFEHLGKLARSHALRDIEAIVAHLHGRDDFAGKIGTLGFSVGGHIAFLAATAFDIAACACFYGGWLTNTKIALSQPTPTANESVGIAKHGGRIVYFAGGRDHAISASDREELARALADASVRHEMVVYPEAQHGFFCELRDTFDEASRDDAWNRVRLLFGESLRGSTELDPGGY